MSEKQQAECDPIEYLFDSFWASLPEQSANDLADFKKRVLTGLRSVVDSSIDEELNITERRLENARRMREEWRQRAAAESAPGTEEAPPNPA
jgi:hypothetical protein